MKDGRTERRSAGRRTAVQGLAASLALGLGGRASWSETEAVVRREIMFDAWDGPALPVALAHPRTITAATPLLFVMHGVARGARGYRDAWAAEAARWGAIVAAPKFSSPDFPKAEGYQLGDLGVNGARSHDAIEPLFDALKSALGLDAERYLLFGHSAGAQFAHRFLFRRPDARVSAAVAANAGWWLRPIPDIPYPYGLDGAPYEPAHAAQAFARPLTVLLGAEDRRRDGSLRQTAQAEAQGPHRVARGQAFFAAAKALAEAEGAPFAWRLAYAEGVGHSNRAIAPFAARILLGDRAD